MSKDKSIFESVPEFSYSEPLPEIDSQEFEKVIKSRRSVRVYKNSPIPEEVTRKCLELALLAPNSSNLQPWEFYWVRNEDKKQDLIKACFSQPAAKTAQEIIVAVARTKTWKQHARQMLDLFHSKNTAPPKAVFNYYKKLVPMAYSLGLFNIYGLLKKIGFSVIGLFRPVPREPVNKAELRIWAVKSTALACENLMLAYRAYGYDTCPMEGYDSKRIKKILDLPSDATIVMAISAGKRDDKGVYGPQVRFPSEQFIKEVNT